MSMKNRHLPWAQGSLSQLQSLFPNNVICKIADERDWATDCSSEELAFIQHAVEKRVSEFRAGRNIARRVLSHFNFNNHILLNDHDRVPIWPDGIFGSITHAAGCCAIAIATAESKCIGLGLDIESADPLSKDLVSSICSNEEFESFEGNEQYFMAKCCFSIKEAVYKSLYPTRRKFLGFHDVETQINLKAGTFRARLVNSGEQETIKGKLKFDVQFIYAGVYLDTVNQ